MGKILILVTNHATLGTTEQANGTFAPELTHALEHLLSVGFEYDIASIKGGAVPLYGTEITDGVNERLLDNADLQTRLNNSIPVTQLNSDDYVAVFYPGGFGLLSDLATDKSAAAISAAIYDKGAVVGAVCHGPAALLAITLADGTPMLKGKSVTGFTREEEIDFGTIEHIPFLLEEALTRNSGSYHKVAPWGEHVIVDERLITGQNPASAAAVAKAMIEALQAA